MPEIGRPADPNQSQYTGVTMAPKALSNRTAAGAARSNEDIINRATGQKPKGIHKDGPHNQMGKDEFLKLLTFQLQNQDPMNPMDQGKMTGELAQFSQLEQLSNLNAKFDSINKNQAVQDKFYAANFVGKQVVTSGATLKVTEEGGDADVLFKLDSDASRVMVRILDEKGQIVGEIWKDGMSKGSHEVTWDGVTTDGQLTAKGTYRAMVKAWDDQNQEIAAQTQASGYVTGVSFDEGEPVLTVDGQKVFLRDVVSFQSAPQGAVGHAMQNMPGAQRPQNNLRLNNAQAPSAQQAANAYKATQSSDEIYE
jgi:flagellar basal-body rod modification protein FlgD